jgi:hypothetical protein
MEYIYGRNDRVYVAKATTFSTIRNTTGTASLAATDAVKHKTLTARVMRNRIAASDKEATAYLGYIDRTRRGRYSGSASLTMPLFSGPSAGVEPDHGCILESAFGKKTISAGVSVTYAADASATILKYLNETTPVTCELWGLNAALRGVVSYGALVNRLRITGGQDSAELSADFVSYYTLAQDRFANAIAAEKGGITAWPTEPATQTYTGSEMTGFTGHIVLDGITYTALRNFTLTANLNRGYRMDKFTDDGSEYFPYGPFEMMPEFTLDVSLWSNDSSDLTALLQKIANRTSVDATLVIGATAGGIYTIPLNNLIKPDGDEDPVSSDGDDRKSIDSTGLRAQATSTSVRDEVSLVIT